MTTRPAPPETVIAAQFPADWLAILAGQASKRRFAADTAALLAAQQQRPALALDPAASEPAPRAAGTVQLIETPTEPALIEGHAEPELADDPAFVRLDPELGRLAVARREFVPLRVWLYAHAAQDGSGRIDRETLFNHLITLGIVTTRRAYDHILKQGERRYWRGRGRNLWLVGYKALAERLVTAALETRAELVSTNRPGRRKVYLDLSGSLKEAQAQVYAAWLYDKAQERFIVTGSGLKAIRTGLTISRETLKRLWRRSKNTLLEWEHLTGVTSEPNFAQHDDPTAAAVPDHAYLCQDKRGREFASWRLPNTYHAPEVKQHSHAGNRRKIRAAVNATVEATEQPVFVCADGAQPTGRFYFADKQTKRGYVSAFTSIKRHLRKHGDTDRRHYAKLGRRYGVNVYECSTGIPHTSLDGRDFKTEHTPGFTGRRVQYRMAWYTR